MSKPANKAQAAPQAQPRIMIRSEAEFRHDVFKLEAASMKKNTSWKKFEPMIVEMPHGHIFHSVNSRGKKQTKCAAVGGHFHQMTQVTLPDGTLSAECGPPMRQVIKKLGNKYKEVVEQVSWANEEGALIIDDHRHEVTYLGSDYLSAKKLEGIRQSNAAHVQASAPRQAVQNQATPAPATDGFQEVPSAD